MIAAYASKSDLDFMKDLESGIPNPQLVNTALTAFKRHLWYLSEELSSLAFFDDWIGEEEKVAMLENLKKRAEGTEEA